MLSSMRQPLRLCIVITGLGVGGAEYALLKLLAAFDRDRFAISVVVLGREDALVPQLRRLGIEPVMLGLKPGRWPFGEIRRLIRSVRALEPDILQGWMYHGNLAASFLGARLGVPVCWSVRDTPDAAHPLSRFTRLVIRVSHWYVDRVTCIFNVSAHSARYCIEHLKWPEKRTVVLPNGLDLDRFRPNASTRRAYRSEWGFSEDELVVGMVARWHPVKNHRLFLEAAALLHKKRPKARFVLVGKRLDEGNQTLKAWITELGLGDAVRLLGQHAELEALYPAFDLVALTSRSEGFPNVLAEALACGVLVVSTNVGDAREIVAGHGRIVAARPEAMAEAWAEILDDPTRAARGLAGRRHIAANYAVEQIAARLMRYYTRFAAAKPPKASV
ncbi:MAG: glycosyltransferase [Betaproteobacteria bacterium]|nr:glycosyltransferase [Betaproteobacteria bacterium]